MRDIISKFEAKQLEKQKRSLPEFRAGDSVNVKYRITEGDNTRIQSFAGTVIATTKSFAHYSSTFTVRKISDGIGVERKFMIHSPLLAEVEVLKRGIVRRAKLYYLRKLKGKSSRIEENLSDIAKISAAKATAKAAAKVAAKS